MCRLLSVLIAGVWLLQASAAFAFPSRQMTIVVPFPPGTNADTTARLLADRLTRALKQPVIIENKSGGATIPGTMAVLQAPADGHTMLQSGTNTNINTLLGLKPPYDIDRDLTPVVLVVKFPAVLVVHESVPASSVAEFIALAKVKPGALSYSSPGTGNFAHLAMEQFNQLAGTQIVHVPFRGLGPAMLGLLRNDVQVMISDIPGALEHIRSGKLRGLAQTGTSRMPQLPDLPTLAEAGLAGYEAAGFLGVWVASGTPPEALAVLNREINEALTSPELSHYIANNGLIAGGGSADDFVAFLKRDRAIWSRVVAEAGIKME